MASFDFNGVFLPMPTCFDEKGRLDLENYAKNIQVSNKRDFKGIVVSAKMGEMPSLTPEERVQLVQVAKENIKPGRQLIGMAGQAATRCTIELANKMNKAGCNAVLIYPPRLHNPRQINEGYLNHFKEIADEVKVPIIIYNIPTYTSADLDAKLVTQLASHPNIVGMIDNSENPIKIEEIVTATKSLHFKVIAGSSHFWCEYVQAGATNGCLTGTAAVLPEEMKQIWDLLQSNSQAEAQKVQKNIASISALFKKFYGPAGLKYVMDKQGQYFGGPTRSPIMPLTKEEQQTLENDWKKSGYGFCDKFLDKKL